MENATQRDAYAMQLMGKSAQELNPLILGGADDLKKYGEEAEKAGLILSQDTLDGANELADAIDKIKATVTASMGQVGSELADSLIPIIENGIGKTKGFEILEILTVAHGGQHNDTLVTVEIKQKTLF